MSDNQGITPLHLRNLGNLPKPLDPKAKTKTVKIVNGVEHYEAGEIPCDHGCGFVIFKDDRDSYEHKNTFNFHKVCPTPNQKPVDDNQTKNWLEIQAEADYWVWVIETMYEKAGRRSPLTQMIDDATGYTGALLKEAEYAMSQFRRCKKELEKLNAK